MGCVRCEGTVEHAKLLLAARPREVTLCFDFWGEASQTHQPTSSARVGSPTAECKRKACSGESFLRLVETLAGDLRPPRPKEGLSWGREVDVGTC